jgi:bacterioferritin-associated ferredoxin
LILTLVFTFSYIDIMIVCSCKGITDRVIRTLVRDGACSMRDIGRACEAGRRCGGCRPTIDRLMLTEKRQSVSPRDMMRGYGR